MEQIDNINAYMEQLGQAARAASRLTAAASTAAKNAALLAMAALAQDDPLAGLDDERRDKHALARAAQPGAKPHPGPSLLQRIRETGLPVVPCPAHEEDRLEAHMCDDFEFMIEARLDLRCDLAIDFYGSNCGFIA